MAPGDLLVFETWGGGGWGDPYARDPEKVARDVRRGLVSAAGADRFGVALTADNRVDEAATAALRAARREFVATVFNRGGSIEELKARCETETGLPPPVAPSQSHLAALRRA